MRLFRPNVGKMTRKGDLAGLLRALSDREAAVRRDAARALGEIADPRALGGLVAALADPDLEVRERVCEVLPKFGSAALPPLTEALAGESEDRSLSAAAALLRMGYDHLRAVAKELRDQASRGDTRVLGPFIFHLGAAEWVDFDKPQDAEEIRGMEVTLGASFVLREIGEAAADSLLRALDEQNPRIRARAVVLLAEIGVPRVQEPVTRCLDDTDPAVRISAVFALKNLKAPEAVGPLIRALSDPDQRVRERAKEALVQFGPLAVHPLIRAFQGASEETRSAVAEPLILLGAPAREALIAHLDEPDWHVRKWVLGVLWQMGDRRAFDAVVAAVADDSPEIRAGAVEFLGATRDPAALRILLTALQDKDDKTCAAAADALGAFPEPEVVSALTAILNDSRRPQAVRLAAIRGLRETGDRRAEEVLLTMARKDDEQDMVVRGLAAVSVSEMRESASR